jgi:mono/diheme cytochrome c family protein
MTIQATQSLGHFLVVAGLVFSTACEEPPRAPDPGTFPQSSALGISDDGKTLFVALPDHDRVKAVDAKTGALKGESTVVGAPHRLTVLRDGRVAVTARLGGTLSILSSDASTVEAQVEVGAMPHGVVQVDDDVVVAVTGMSELARIALDNPNVVKDRVALETPDPRGLATTPDGTLYVTHFSAGVVSTVAVEDDTVAAQVDMHLPSNPYFFPNHLESMTVTPSGEEVAAPHEECNNDPAQFNSGGDFSGAAAEYYVQGPTGFPAVVPAVSRIDTASRVSVSDGPGNLNPVFTPTPEPAGPAPTLINPLDTPLLGMETLVNGPVALALADGGRLELLVNRGSGNVLLRRTRLKEGDKSILGVVDVGTGAEDIVLSPSGKQAYVLNRFTYEITRFDVPSVEMATTLGHGRASVERFTDQENANNTFAGQMTAEELPRLDHDVRFAVAAPTLPDEVSRGRILFHTVDDRMTRRGAIACASCHPGGSADGITWNFKEGPRNTPALWGGIMDTAPFHWDQAVADVTDLNHVTIQGRMGGMGLSEADLRDIGEFIDTLPAPAGPMENLGGDVDRGREIFYSEEAQCASCHTGSDFTDGLAHDVGTGVGMVERETRDTFATPVLHGLFATAPYLHDGSAGSLHDVVEKLVVTDLMGKGSHLSPTEIDDLVAFLKTL